MIRIFISFLIVSLGQPSWIPYLCPIAACCGFALFWSALLKFERKKFWLSWGWFFAVQLVQLSWMSSIEYQGFYILAVWALLALGMGLQFALFSYFVTKRGALASFSSLMGLASCWTLFEWSRLFLLCGFTFNPTGLSLSAFSLSMQLAAIGGVFFLTFWVMLTNLVGLKFFIHKDLLRKRKKHLILWLNLAIFPYLFGAGWWMSHQSIPPSDTLSVALVQTGLREGEKVKLLTHLNDFIPPLYQWDAIMTYLRETGRNTFDLIVLPEAALPYGAYEPLYLYSQVKETIKKKWGEEAFRALPALKGPMAVEVRPGIFVVSNAFLSQFLSNFFKADVVIGLDDHDFKAKKSFASAFQFRPLIAPIRYDKQVLVPLVEYIPFQWCKKIVEKYGITSFFEKGESPKAMEGKVPFAITICYEESFGEVVRKSRMGASLLVNVSNYGWFPSSRLPDQSFNLARLRAVENGVFVVRACNTGVTGAINPFGEVIKRFGDINKNFEFSSGALVVDLPIITLSTIYSRVGDFFVIGLSCMCVLFLIVWTLPLRRVYEFILKLAGKGKVS